VRLFDLSIYHDQHVMQEFIFFDLVNSVVIYIRKSSCNQQVWSWFCPGIEGVVNPTLEEMPEKREVRSRSAWLNRFQAG
jgi:hypothetical protein